MKEVLLKKDLLAYLHHEMDAIRKMEIDRRAPWFDESFQRAYKQGQVAALQRVFNYVYGINTRLQSNSKPSQFD